MIDMDWNAPVGGTSEVLACVPGLKPDALAQWLSRGRISRRGTGHGRAIVWNAHDVLEIATLYELGRFGVLIDKAVYVWATVRGVMLQRQTGLAYALAEPCILFTLDDKGLAVVRLFDELAEEDAPTGSALSRPDAPDVALLFRVGRFMERVAERIAAVAPDVVRSRGLS